MVDRHREHIEVFNEAVRSGDWDEFVARFADDAVLSFPGLPVGPFVGRSAIAVAYAESPPDDQIDQNGPAVADAGTEVVPYRWRRTGATGTMRFTTDAEGRITRLEITFD